MKISAIRSDKVYSKIMNAPLDKKNDIYRYELMKPFEKKWACYSVPMKALTPNGYDVIMASEMLGHIAPTAVDQKQQNNIKLISDNTLWEKCELSIQQSLNCFVEHGVNLPIPAFWSIIDCVCVTVAYDFNNSFAEACAVSTAACFAASA